MMLFMTPYDSTPAYFGNVFTPFWHVQRVKKREDHDDGFMFEVMCTRPYFLTPLKRIYLVIHLDLSEECLCVCLCACLHVCVCVEAEHQNGSKCTLRTGP